METGDTQNKVFITQILTFIALSAGLILFHTLWDNAIIGLIVSLILFFILLNRQQLQMFKSLSQFQLRDLYYLLPVLLEWLVAFPIQFWLLGNVNWEQIMNAGGGVVLNAIFTQLLSNFREEIGTSFCWLMIAFFIMRLLKVGRLEKSHMKIAIVIMSILFALLHLPNAIILATHPAIDLKTKIIGVALVLINAFILGLYFKTTYIQTRSIQTVLIVHIICGLRRSLFPLTNPNIGMITLQQIGAEALILTLYLVVTMVIWRKKWDLALLAQIYDNLAHESNLHQ